MNNNDVNPKQMYVPRGRQSLLNSGFTLIELLAVIVILAIIAVIAVPQILNLIDDSKEKSTKLSAQNYLKAVELAVMNEDISSDINLAKRIEFEIIEGKKIYSTNNTEDISDDITIDIEYDGNGLTEGIIIVENYKVVKTFDLVSDGNGFIFLDDSGDIVLEENIKRSTLVDGKTFNSKVKNLVNNITEKDTKMTHTTEDTKVKSIEFYSFGKLPKGYTKESLKNLPSVDLTLEQNNSIMAYNNDGKIYVYSDDFISLNEVSSYMFYNFTSLLNIDFGNITTSNVTDMSAMFGNCSSLTGVDLNNFNTGKVTNMNSMFNQCFLLEFLNLSNFNTSKVESTYQMFRRCEKLNNIKFGQHFNIKNVIMAKQMFMNCAALTELDLRFFDTLNVKDMSGMFLNCHELTNIIFGDNFITSNVTDMSSMFTSCANLESLDLSSFNTNSVENMSQMFSYTGTFKVSIGEKWTVKNATTTNMFQASGITNQEELLSK